MSSDSQRADSVFVTGGTGFVGSHLVEALNARGHQVRCLVRRNPGWLAEIAHTPVAGDLTDVDALAAGIAGCDTVYHVAGVTRARNWEAFHQANVQGTHNMLEACLRQSPAPRVVVVSSLAAVGRATVPIAHEWTPLYPVSRYGRSKAIMEQEIARYHDRLALSIVRPPAVYGPRDSDIFTVFKGASRGLFAVVGGTDGPALTLVHVRDLVQGMIQCAESKASIGKTYFLGRDPAHSWDEVRDAAAEALEKRVLTLRIPSSLILPVGAAVEFFGRLAGAYPPLNREKAREIRDATIMCSSQSARTDFGYSPGIPLKEGFEEAVHWYRAQGWL